MLTLAAFGRDREFRGNPDAYPRHRPNTGASKQDVLEAFQHVAIYAGVPRANHALKLAKATYAEMEDAND